MDKKHNRFHQIAGIEPLWNFLD